MNNKTLITITIIAIILLLIYYFYTQNQKSKKLQEELGTEGASSTTSTTTSTPTTSTSTSTPTPTSTNTSTSTSTPPTLPSNQIKLTKETPVYYLQLPGSGPNQTPVHSPSNGTVQGVTLPKDSDSGDIITITKSWNFGGNNIYYETTQKVKYLTNPSQHGIGDYYLIKKSDV